MVRPRRDRHTEATRRALLQAARRRFAAQGYAGAAIEDIARRARVTTGALYHHFRNKRDLFRAVAEEVEQELMDRSTASAQGRSDPWEILLAGIEVMLDACSASDVLRIVFRDAPNVIGPDAWREIEGRYAFGSLRALIQRLMETGVIAPRDVDLVARVVLAALSEVAQSIASADDPDAARAEGGELVSSLLRSLRAPPPG